MIFSRELLQKIKESVNLVHYAKLFTDIKKCGENLWSGPCPHPDHPETIPSFRIWYDPKTKLYSWMCYGCHSDKKNTKTQGKKNYGTDCFSFYQWIHDYEGSKEKKTWQEAVKFFAEKYNIPLEPDPNEPLYKKQRDSMILFENNLFQFVKEYLYTRGLSNEDIKEYRIGYDGKRIIFPLLDREKRCVGFCKRVLDQSDEPKYLNSRTSPIFHKKKYFYGAWKIDNDYDYVIITEGIMDVILALKYGFKNVLSMLGTAFSEEHLSQIKGKKVYLCFDGDSAGKKAIDRTLNLLNEHKIEARILLLPDKQDLADFCLENKEDSTRLLQTSINSWEYYLRPIEDNYRVRYNQLLSETVPQIRSIISNLPTESEKTIALNHIEKFLNIKKEFLC